MMGDRKAIKSVTNEDLVIKYQTTKNAQVLNTLWENVVPLVAYKTHISREYFVHKGGSWEDYLSCVKIVFMNCVSNFDPSKDVKFSSFFGNCVAFNHYDRELKKANMTRSLDEVISESAETETSLSEVLPDNSVNIEEDFCEKEIKSKVVSRMKDCLSVLTKEELDVVNLYVFKQVKQCDVAKKLGITQVQVSRNFKKAKDKLMNYIIENHKEDFDIVNPNYKFCKMDNVRKKNKISNKTVHGYGLLFAREYKYPDNWEKGLTEFAVTCIKEYAFNNKTTLEISELTGRSRSRVGQCIRETLSRIDSLNNLEFSERK